MRQQPSPWPAIAAALLLSTPAAAQDAPQHPNNPFFGVWESTNADPPVQLMVFDQQNFYWNQDSGRYQTSDGAVWFLDNDKTGTRWTFRFADGGLQLTAPEDFRYLGGGEYLYLQFTDPQTELHLRQALVFGTEYPTQRFDGGQRQTTIAFSDVRTGVQRQYRQDGSKEAEIHFRDGQLNGAYTVWDKDGQIVQQKQYKDGTLLE